MSGQITGVLWEPRRGRMTSAGEDVTWNRCHLEVAFELSLGGWEGLSWWGGWRHVPGSEHSTDKGWRCRERCGPWPGCSACLPWAQCGPLQRCCYSLLRARQCTPNRTVVPPMATSSVVSASRGSLGRLGEEGPPSALDTDPGPQGLCLGPTICRQIPWPWGVAVLFHGKYHLLTAYCTPGTAGGNLCASCHQTFLTTHWTAEKTEITGLEVTWQGNMRSRNMRLYLIPKPLNTRSP